MMASYAYGQSVRLTGIYIGADGLLGEPTTAVLRVRKPSGIIIVYSYADGTLERIGDSQYGAVIVSNEYGRWLYEFTGTGNDGETPARMSYFDVLGGF
jgi:hypothetical protein